MVSLEKCTCIRTWAGTWRRGLQLDRLRFVLRVVAVEFATILRDNVEDLVKPCLHQTLVHGWVIMNKDKLSVMTIKPVDRQNLLTGTDSADISEEVLVVGCSGQGKLCKYLTTVNQTTG